MFRSSSISAIVCAAVLLPSPARAGDVRAEIAIKVTAATVNVALANLRTQYSEKVISVNMARKANAPRLALSKTIEIKVRADEVGKPILTDPEDTRIYMEMTVDVEVVALYPLHKIHFVDGVLHLPEPEIVSGYAKPEGERGTAIYNPGGFIRLGGWSEDKKQVVQSSLAYAALNAAKRQFQKEKVCEELEREFALEFSKHAEHLQKQLDRWGRYEGRQNKTEQER